MASGFVGGGDELLGAFFEVGFGDDDSFEFFGFYHAGESVAAEEKEVAVSDVYGFEVNFDFHAVSEGAGDDVFPSVVFGFFFGEDVALSLLVNPTVVFGKLVKGSFSEAITS